MEDDLKGDVRARVSALLGKDKLRYMKLIEELIFMEDTFS